MFILWKHHTLEIPWEDLDFLETKELKIDAMTAYSSSFWAFVY